jgi:hypothetical protein
MEIALKGKIAEHAYTRPFEAKVGRKVVGSLGPAIPAVELKILPGIVQSSIHLSAEASVHVQVASHHPCRQRHRSNATTHADGMVRVYRVRVVQ